MKKIFEQCDLSISFIKKHAFLFSPNSDPNKFLIGLKESHQYKNISILSESSIYTAIAIAQILQKQHSIPVINKRIKVLILTRVQAIYTVLQKDTHVSIGKIEQDLKELYRMDIMRSHTLEFTAPVREFIEEKYKCMGYE